MIPETAAGKTLADAQVRPAIVSALDHSDIEAICGGMDATPYLRPAGPNDERSTAGELVKVSGLILVQGQTYRSTREGSFLEYRFRSPVPERGRSVWPWTRRDPAGRSASTGPARTAGGR